MAGPLAAPFPRDVIAGDTLHAARAILGARLVRESVGAGVRIGRIVEVEAYVGTEDAASHARFGRTRRNAVMFGPPGVAYVYLVYGMYECLNVVTEPEGRPAALLVRAVEPLEGLAAMREARLDLEAARRRSAGRDEIRRRLDRVADARLAAGPGLVCAAFSIGRSDDGLDLCEPTSRLRLMAGEAMASEAIAIGPRVGIGYASEPWQSNAWRFWVAGNPAVSKPTVSTR